MADKFCVSLTEGKSNLDKATVAFVVANAALGSEKETLVFLSSEGVHLSQQGYSDGAQEEGCAAIAELIASFGRGGGKIIACAPCFKKRGLDESKLVDGCVVAGGTALIECRSGGDSSISY